MTCAHGCCCNYPVADWPDYKADVRLYGTDGKLLARNKDATVRVGPQFGEIYGEVPMGMLRTGTAEMAVIKIGDQYFNTKVSLHGYKYDSVILTWDGKNR